MKGNSMILYLIANLVLNALNKFIQSSKLV